MRWLKVRLPEAIIPQFNLALELSEQEEEMGGKRDRERQREGTIPRLVLKNIAEPKPTLFTGSRAAARDIRDELTQTPIVKRRGNLPLWCGEEGQG